MLGREDSIRVWKRLPLEFPGSICNLIVSGNEALSDGTWNKEKTRRLLDHYHENEDYESADESEYTATSRVLS